MADTTFLKGEVARYVRDHLAAEYGTALSAEFLPFTTGGKHEFDAVSADLRVIASIKSSSGKTSGGRLPSGKIKNAIAEVYFLTLAEAPVRLLVLTNPDFHAILSREMQGRLAKGLAFKLVDLLPEMAKRVLEVQDKASREVSGPSRNP